MERCALMEGQKKGNGGMRKASKGRQRPHGGGSGDLPVSPVRGDVMLTLDPRWTADIS